VAAALERLKQLHPKRIDLTLDRVERLLDRMGHPEGRLPPVVHVAGTNGKGSVVAFLRAILEAAGHRVHVYTSPHLVRFNERIRLAGHLISDAHLADVLDRAERVNDGAEITYFEITTCAAFLAFTDVPADLLLLEVGLGGRLDATNVIERPAASAITRISMDHLQFLGPTIEAIAAEKAGVVKPGVPVVVAPQRSAAAAGVLAARAERVGAPLLLHGRDWAHALEGGRLAVTTPAGQRLLLPRPVLPGAHQHGNAAAAVILAGLLGGALGGRPVDEEALAAGLLRAEWPARLQRLTRGPLPAALPEGWELWLDGGHNDSAGEVLGEWLAETRAADPRPVHVVAGMLDTKSPLEFLGPLAPHAASLSAVPVPGEPASLPAEALAAAGRSAGFAAAAAVSDVGGALAALAAGPGPARVLICGSLYLAGSVLAENGS
jgi:dihydrofolate synthase/folylpolyglutamate synthase